MSGLSDAAIEEQPINALLAGYAAGALSAPLHVLVASHLAMSHRNRSFVSALETVEAAAMMEAKVVAIRARDEKLAAIFGLEDEPYPVAGSYQPIQSVIPYPLKHYMGFDLKSVPWRTKLPGIISEYRIAETEAGEASLLWIKAGKAMPSHTHEGMEVTLVLQGGFKDISGHYERGDVAVADSDIDHKPVADADEDCICFAVTDAPLRLTGPVPRFFRKILGH